MTGMLFWLIAGSALAVGCVDGWLGADVFLRERGVSPGRLSLPLAGLLGGLYVFAVCATLMAILRCPYPLAADVYSNAPGLVWAVAMSPVGLLVLALASKLRPVIAGLGRGEPVLLVVGERPGVVHEVAGEPDDEPAFAEPTVYVTEVDAEPQEAELVGRPEQPRIFDRGDLADEWAAIDRRLRRAAA